MIQENKELLLKDLCARSPYGVKVMTSVGGEIRNDKEQLNFAQLSLFENSYEDIKPYLFPLSSITEEQSMELFKLFGISLVDSIDTDYIKINECTGITFFLNKGFDVETHLDKLIDWLNKNHFDWRGLIPMGLAIDATNLNIY
jgi:hypothetical protein